MGLRVFTEDDLDRTKAHFDKADLPAKFVMAPHQGRTLRVADPVGTPLELCATMETMPRLTVAFDTWTGVSPQRIDHFQILVPDVPRAMRVLHRHGIYQMMDIENQPVRWNASYTHQRGWGLPPRRKWHFEAPQFAGVAPCDPVRMPDPYTLEKFLGEQASS